MWVNIFSSSKDFKKACCYLPLPKESCDAKHTTLAMHRRIFLVRMLSGQSELSEPVYIWSSNYTGVQYLMTYPIFPVCTDSLGKKSPLAVVV